LFPTFKLCRKQYISFQDFISWRNWNRL